jgi:tight adherence protein B
MSIQLIFLLLVFATVVLLTLSFLVSFYSPLRADTKLIKKHLQLLALTDKNIENDLLINSRVNQLPVFGRWLESLPWIANLTYKMELSGSKLLGHQYLLLTLSSSVMAFLGLGIYSQDWVFSMVCAVLVLFGFHIKLIGDMNKRMEKLEEQFPQALDVLKRGLQAGYAFNEAIKLVVEEMEGELADEFKIMFNRINFGNDIKTALLYFVKRVPSPTAMAFSSAVAIQKSTGGNLAENVDNLSVLIRQRFTFKRRVKTLSAEGRLSGWVLVLMPFVLFALLYISSPSYVSTLISTPEGRYLLKWGAGGMLLGILWINKLVQIDI